MRLEDSKLILVDIGYRFKEKLSTSIERCEKRSISLEIKRKINDGNGDESYSLSSSHVFNQKGKRVKDVLILLQKVLVYSCWGIFLISAHIRYIEPIDSKNYCI